jgi:chromosome segregation ATPase
MVTVLPGTLPGMAHPSDFEARLAALEARVEEVAADAAAARHLAAARDRDLADLGLKVDANRSVINALGEQTAARFDRLEERFDRLDHRADRLDHRVDRLEQKVDTGFAEMRGKLDQAAAGQQQITHLLTTLIDQEGEE